MATTPLPPMEIARDIVNGWYAAEMAACLRNPKRRTPSGDFTLLTEAIAAAIGRERGDGT